MGVTECGPITMEDKNQMIETKKFSGRKQKRIITDNNDDQIRWWSDFPYDILELIKKSLFFIDQVKFHSVCKSWSSIERTPPLQQMPWLLVFGEDSFHLIDAKYKKTYIIDTKAIKDKLKMTKLDAMKLNAKKRNGMKVHDSKYGWLLISKCICELPTTTTTTLFFYSPFFSEKYNFIDIPSLNNDIMFATFTSNPLDEDCKILTLNQSCIYNDNLVINTFNRRQSSWSRQIVESKFQLWHYKTWIYSEGILYFVTKDGTVGKFDLAIEEWNVFPPLPLPVPLPVRRYTFQTLSNLLEFYMVKSSDGELFLILERNFHRRYNEFDFYHIYRLDLSSMTWEGLDSIGDRVLFVGEGYNCILDSLVLKLNAERKEISEKIYYCFNDKKVRCCSVHDYADKTRTTPRKQDCSRDYGSIAKLCCRMLLIDPPPR